MGVLRLLLAVSVMLCHAGLQLVDGVTSVRTFFMLSGFYMALVLSHPIRRKERLLQEPGA